MKEALAHELVGHREAQRRNKSKFKPNDPLDEAQASIRAARFTPGLTKEERYLLLRDAIDRLGSRGIKIREVKNLLDIMER